MIDFLKTQSSLVIDVDTDKICTELGSTKIVNMLLLGAACKSGIIKKDELKAAIKLLVKPDFYELNVKAVDYF